MRTEQTDRAAGIVARTVIAAAARTGREGGSYHGAEWTARDLNAARWEGTNLAGTHFDPAEEAQIARSARFLSETEAGWNILNPQREEAR